jgi:hypothetical protein
MSFLDKAKDLLGQHDDKVDQAIDKGAEAAKGRFQGHDGMIDGIAGKAKDYEWSDQQAAAPQAGEAPAEPPAGPPPGEQPPAE